MAMWIAMLLLGAIAVFGIVAAVQYLRDIEASYERPKTYDVKTLNTEFGPMSYLDEGQGEAAPISHGVFGGYDQGMNSLRQLPGTRYRKISIPVRTPPVPAAQRPYTGQSGEGLQRHTRPS